MCLKLLMIMDSLSSGESGWAQMGYRVGSVV
jgi:hypothetical protein